MLGLGHKHKDLGKGLHWFNTGINLYSKTVYSNWPTAQTPLHYVTSVDFSANSGMLAVGNDRGKVLLYRLKHYHSV